MSFHKSWGEFYEKSDCAADANRYIHTHKELLRSIISEKPRAILEAGCGSGIFSIHLSKLGYDCTAVDNDQKVLDVARKNNELLGGGAKFLRADIENLPFKDHAFDVVFSQGVLEHFSNVEIRRVLNEQLRVGRVVVFSVPHFFYRNKDFGNERLLTKLGWWRVLRGYRVVESLGYYRIRRKKNLFLKFPQMYLAKISSS